MNDLVIALVPLVIGSALVPVHIVITVLLVRGPAGRVAAMAWIGGMTAVRLVQGLVFGLFVEAEEAAGGDEGSAVLAAAIQLVLAIVFYVLAGKKLLNAPEEDAPPPRWMAMFDGVAPGRAFALGAGLVLISAKFWVFTLGAISAIAAADLGQAAAVGTFLVFVVLAQGVHLGVAGFAFAAPARADVALGRFSDWLTAYTRPIMVVLGLVFGTWFLLKALDGLGIL